MTVCVLVCAHVCVCACALAHLHACTHIQVPGHAYVCVYRCQKSTLNMFFSPSPFLRCSVSEPKAPGLTQTSGRGALQVSACACLPTAKVTHALQHSLLHLELCSASGDLNSGSCAYATSTLPTQPPCSPSFILNVWFTDVKYSPPQFLELSSFVL